MDSRKHLLIRDGIYALDMPFALRYKGDIMYSVELHIPPSEDSYVVHHGNSYWQLEPYVDGVSLKRPDYVFDRISTR